MKIKVQGNDKMFGNCVDFTEFFLKLPEKCKKNKIRKHPAHDSRWENVIYWGSAALSHHTNKHTMIICLKNKYVS